MLFYISLLVLQNIWSVTGQIIYAKDLKCIYLSSPDVYPPPLAYNDQNNLLPRYYEVSHQTRIRLSCPGDGNYFKRAESEKLKEVQDLEFHCYLGSWRGVLEPDDHPLHWACGKHPEGRFEQSGECSQKSTRYTFIVNKSIPMFSVCRTKEGPPRTVSASHMVASLHLPQLQPPEDAALPGRTFPIEAYSGYTGDPIRFKRYQQVEMVRKYGMKNTFKYFGSPELDLSLTPTRVVPLEHFPQLDGLQAEHNSFLLYSSVLEHLQIIHEAIRELSTITERKIYVLTFTSSDNKMFEEVKLFTPNSLVILVRQNGACLAFMISNRLDLALQAQEYRCEASCSDRGWPDLLDPTKGFVECCTFKEVKTFYEITFDCEEDNILLGPQPLPKEEDSET